VIQRYCCVNDGSRRKVFLNVRADRTIIVFGVFLFLVGLAVAVNGYGYVQVERGWTLVISGTIGFCTGLVMIALGLVLRELESISASSAKSALFLAKSKNDAAQPVEQATFPQRVEPAAEETQRSFEPAPAPLAEMEPALASVAQDFAAPLEPAKVEEAAPPLPEENDQPKPPSWMIRAGSYASAFAAARVSDAPPAQAPETSREQFDWPRKAVEEAQQPAPTAPETEQAEAPVEVEPVSAILEETPFELPPEEAAPETFEAHEEQASRRDLNLEPEPEPQPATEPEPQPEPQPEAEPPATAVVGHYEAHGARYTMYADGSIDAVTPHGVYRFPSMDELKRFIEKSS
jgi:hypothetical protein